MKKSILSAMLLLAGLVVSAAELTFVTTIGAPVGVFSDVTSSEKGYVNQLNFLTIKNGAADGTIALQGKEGEDNIYAKLGQIYLSGAETAKLHSEDITAWNSQEEVWIRRGDIDVEVAALDTDKIRFCEPKTTGGSSCVAQNATLGIETFVVDDNSTVGPAAFSEIKKSSDETWFPKDENGKGPDSGATGTWEQARKFDTSQNGKIWVLQAK